MAHQDPGTEAGLADNLNDLLRLEHDAVRAYTVAFDGLRSDRLRLAIRVFRTDHERHVADLTSLVRGREARPLEEAEVPAGPFEQAVRAAAAEDDRAVLQAFRSHETHVRDRYRLEAARAMPEDVGAVVRRLAADEERHRAWVMQALEALGGRAEPTAEVVDATTIQFPAGETTGEPEAAAVEPPVDEAVLRSKAARDRVREEESELAASERALGAAGAGLEGAARGLERAASWAGSRGGKLGRMEPPARRAAHALAREGTHLRQQDVDAVKRDLEGGMHAHPIRAVLLAASLGYIVGRMLR